MTAKDVKDCNDLEQMRENWAGDVLDLFSHHERVKLFMEECTDMSKEFYSIPTLKKLIKERKERDIADWCFLTVEDVNYAETDLREVIENKAKESTFN